MKFLTSKHEEYLISSDKSLLSLSTVVAFLHRSSWAAGRPIEVIEKSIRNSECIGAYLGDKQVGFLRIVTDYCTAFWLCDVFVSEEHRRMGLGSAMLELLLSDPDLNSLYGVLATKDMHQLYKKAGFVSDGHHLMHRVP